MATVAEAIAPLSIGAGSKIRFVKVPAVDSESFNKSLESIFRDAIENSKRSSTILAEGTAAKLPFADNLRFGVSLNALHNLYLDDLWSNPGDRASGGRQICCRETYRNEREKVNLL